MCEKVSWDRCKDGKLYRLYIMEQECKTVAKNGKRNGVSILFGKHINKRYSWLVTLEPICPISARPNGPHNYVGLLVSYAS